MQKFKFIVYFLVIFQPLYLFAQCNHAINQEVLMMLESGKYRDTQKLESLYDKCNDNTILMLLKLSKGDHFENKQEMHEAFLAYKEALNALESLDEKVLELGDIKKYLIRQIDQYGSIDSHTLQRGYIGTRGAVFQNEDKVKGIPLNFDTAHYTIRAGENLNQASNIGKVLSAQEYKNKVIYIAGYTDTRGNRHYNKKLGEQRAESLKQYLVKEFQLKNEIVVESKGERFPLCLEGQKMKLENGEYTCSEKEDYYASRRVVITVRR